MKRVVFIALIAVAAACWAMPCKVQAHGRFVDRLRTAARVPMRLIRAPFRFVRTIDQHRCGCSPKCDCFPECFCNPATTPRNLTNCAASACPVK